MDEREILEELRRLVPRRAPAPLGERILLAGKARARRAKARRKWRMVLAAAACLALYAAGAGWGPLPGEEGGSRALAVETQSILVETEARKALLQARIARLERLASSVPGKDRHLKILRDLRKKLDELVVPLPKRKKNKAEKSRDNKKSWIPPRTRNGGWQHV